MRVFSEEQKSGSIETLMTLPVTETQVVLGKFLASFISSSTMLIPTLFYIITILFFGMPYFGAVLLCAVYSATGVFASAITKNQIIAFFTSLGINAAFTLIHFFMVFIPGTFVKMLNYFSIVSHFNSVARGIIDTRDVIYFITLIAVFIIAAIHVQEKRRK